MQNFQDFDPQRRSLVLGGAAMAGLGAAGCSTLLPTPQITGLCSAKPQPFLAGPEVVAAWGRPERYFDAHTHFFNARDVPVRQYLAKSVAHSVEPRRLRELIIALAPIAEWMGRAAVSPKAEFDQLCRQPELRTKSVTQQSDDLDAEIEQQRDEVARELYREILKRGPEIPRLFNESTGSGKSRNPSFLANQASVFSEEVVRDALRDGGSSRNLSTNKLSPLSASKMSAEEAESMSMRGVLQFVGFMLSPRHHNLRTFIRKFSEGSPSMPLSGCFAALVDFNYWLDAPSKASNHEDQVRLHSLLSVLSGGFLLPLAPYNPWVDIKESDASLKLVKKGVNDFGCVGVKIYPPMGFFPYNNAQLKLLSPEPRPDLVLLDEKLAALYELCDSLGVPVMAHANDSAGRDAAHDELASSVGWTELTKKMPALTRLYVNAGHFGGALKHESGDWTDGFVSLMKNEGPLRVYGDLGYWGELAGDSAEVKNKIGRVLATKLSGSETVADRVMYGSDWLMLSQEPGWQSYANGIATIIRRLDADGTLAGRVLGDNVLACYGLSKTGGRGRLKKLVDFHAQHGLSGGPGWLQP